MEQMINLGPTRLYSWSARRAGAGITITHSCGKIVNVQDIQPDAEGQVIATDHMGRQFHLVAAVHRS